MRTVLRALARSYVRHSPLRKGRFWVGEAMRRTVDRQEKLTTEVLDRFVMDLDLSDPLQSYIYYFGHFEQGLCSLIEKSVGPGSVMIDVGANVGIFSLLGASLGASCHAFEAAPTVASDLRRNIALNNFEKITVHECAVSDHCGEATFYLYEETGAKTNHGQNALFKRGAGREVVVPVQSLDSCLGNLSRLDFIKSDIEGADLLALRGAQKLIEKFHPIIAVEADQQLSSELGGSIADIYHLLRRHGYQVYSLTPEGVFPVNDIQSSSSMHYTFVARFNEG